MWSACYYHTKVVTWKPADPTPVVPPGPLAQRSVKESWAQWSLSRGVETLPETITEFLHQSGRVQLHREAAVKHISPSASGWKVSEDSVSQLTVLMWCEDLAGSKSHFSIFFFFFFGLTLAPCLYVAPQNRVIRSSGWNIPLWNGTMFQDPMCHQ